MNRLLTSLLLSSALLFGAHPSVLSASDGAAAPSLPDVRIAWDYRSRQTMGDFTADGKEFHQRHYPRLHRLRSGDLLLFFMDGKFGWQIFEQRSKDGGKTWGTPRWLKKSWRDETANDSVAYCNPEMRQLQDGSLLLVYQRRNNRRTNENEGIEAMRSTDSGETWSEPIWAFRGKNWEPSLVQLPSGEIQLFFTDGHTGKAHVSLVRSFDNGKTWTPRPQIGQEEPEYLSRSEGKMPDGTPLSMDGMAVGTFLQNNKGIVYAAECDLTGHKLQPDPITPSIVWSSLSNDWRYPDFASPATGPANRRWAVHPDLRGFAPYLIQLQTGEVIVQSNGRFEGVPGVWTLIGDSDARNFALASRPFNNPAGFWGCVAELDRDHLLSAATTGGNNQQKIVMTTGILNRPLETRNNPAAANAWFIGDSGQAQGTLSALAATNGLNLRFAAQDEKVVGGEPGVSDGFRLSWTVSRGNPSARWYRVTASASASAFLETRSDRTDTWKRVDLPGLTVSRTLTPGGYSLTVAVPWKAVGGPTQSGRRGHLELINVDTAGEVPIVDGMPGEVPDEPITWLPIH